MKNSTPLTSIIMPMRNAEAYVTDAIYSIINQSYRHLELLVIDDQSTDLSRVIVEEVLAKDSRIKLLNGGGKGIAAAKNIGLGFAAGEIVMFCDSDDYYADNRITNQVAWLEEHTIAGAVCASYAMTDHRGKNSVGLVTGNQACEITEELFAGKTRTHLCTFAIRSKVIKLIGGFREFFVSAEDIDFQLRLAEVCRVFYEPNTAYFYRLHDSSIIHTQASTQRVFYEETARTFRQQRAKMGKDDIQTNALISIPENIGVPLNSKVQFQNILLGSAWSSHKQGKKLDAIKKGVLACLTKPTSLLAWKSFVLLFFKR